MVTEGLYLKKKKKTTKTAKIQQQPAGALTACFQNKLQTFKCNNFAIFNMVFLRETPDEV